jgi:hypothetical protein
MWLRRHDEHEESRSVDRFTTAMHTLSRREAKQARESKPSVAAERYGLMPRQVRNVEVHVSGASAPEPRERRVRTPQAKPALTAAQRRRRTLTGLLLVTVVFLVAAVVTGALILWVVQVLGDLSIVAFVVHLRRMAIASAATRSVRPAPAPRRAAPEPVARRASRVEPAYESYADQSYEDEYVAPAEEAPRVTVRRFASEASYPQPAYEQPAYDDYDDYEDEVAPAPVAAVFDQHEEPEPYQPVEYDEPYQPVASAEAGPIVFDQFDEPEPEPEPAPAPRRSFIEAGTQPGRGTVEPEPAPRAEPAPARTETARPDPARDEPFRYEPEMPQAPAASAPTVGGSPWEPVPVPRPTYTMKPAAPPRRRRDPIDEPLLPPIETAAEMDPVDDLEEILDRRWAVND